jgi:hypothetical protein
MHPGSSGKEDQEEAFQTDRRRCGRYQTDRRRCGRYQTDRRRCQLSGGTRRHSAQQASLDVRSGVCLSQAARPSLRRSSPEALGGTRRHSAAAIAATPGRHPAKGNSSSEISFRDSKTGGPVFDISKTGGPVFDISKTGGPVFAHTGPPALSSRCQDLSLVCGSPWMVCSPLALFDWSRAPTWSHSSRC